MAQQPDKRDPRRGRPPLDEELVAYLDGELDEVSVQQIDQLLAKDPEVRRRVQSLGRTWELLDSLDQEEVEQSFTQTTMQLVAVAAEERARQQTIELPRQRRRRWWIAAAGCLACGLAGFLTVLLVWPRPNRQLLEDLPVLEHIDQYRQIQQIEFLQMLHREKLFAREQSPEQKQTLARAQERLAALDPAQQKRLRQLHRDVEADPNTAALRRTMRRYCAWVKKLPIDTQHELLQLAPAERIKRVKQLRREEQHQRAPRLSPEDARFLRGWVESILVRFEKSLPEPYRRHLSELSHSRRRQALIQAFRRRALASPKGRPPISERDLAKLRSGLSSSSRELLRGKPLKEQWRVVAEWIRGVIGRQPGARRPQGGGPPVGDDVLRDFFERMPPSQRDRLLELPGEQMKAELERIYREEFHRPRGRPPGRGRRQRFPDPGHPPAPPHGPPPGQRHREGGY